MHIYTQWINLSIIYKTIRIHPSITGTCLCFGHRNFRHRNFPYYRSCFRIVRKKKLEWTFLQWRRKLKGRGGGVRPSQTSWQAKKKGGMSIVMSNFAKKSRGVGGGGGSVRFALFLRICNTCIPVRMHL